VRKRLGWYRHVALRQRDVRHRGRSQLREQVTRRMQRLPGRRPRFDRLSYAPWFSMFDGKRPVNPIFIFALAFAKMPR
jgi:hypothetical protein